MAKTTPDFSSGVFVCNKNTNTSLFAQLGQFLGAPTGEVQRCSTPLLHIFDSIFLHAADKLFNACTRDSFGITRRSTRKRKSEKLESTETTYCSRAEIGWVTLCPRTNRE